MLGWPNFSFVSAGLKGQDEYVALIREPEGMETVEVAFSESARFYRLLRANPEFERILTLLRKAKKKKRPVYVLMHLAKAP